MLPAARPLVLRSLLSASRPASATAAARRTLSGGITLVENEDDVVSPVTERREDMTKYDKHMVWGTAGEYVPAPVLPEDASELAAIDPVDLGHRTHMDGSDRIVVIRQERASKRQAPINVEKVWKIYFYEDGMVSEKWDNPLMGWTSNADPYQCAPPLSFPNAADAAYFAKKRGWKFVVKHPIQRLAREDDCQYQDNFLPQGVHAKIVRDGISCDHWKRESAGTSHYFRPLKYHGDGTVPQHGPNGKNEPDPHVEGYYKMR